MFSPYVNRIDNELHLLLLILYIYIYAEAFQRRRINLEKKIKFRGDGKYIITSLCMYLLFYCFWICLNMCTCKYPNRMLISLEFMHSINSPVLQDFHIRKKSITFFFSFTNAFSQKLLIFALQHKITNSETFWNSVLQLHSKRHTDRRIVNFTIHVLYEILIIIILFLNTFKHQHNYEDLLQGKFWFIF